MRALEGYFAGQKPKFSGSPLAVVVPHAGYVFSGRTAAEAIAQIDPNAQFKRIFVIGSSHTMHFGGAAVYTSGSFVTPLGRVEVDELAAELVRSHSVFASNPEPHRKEHSLEVQLPLLQHWLKRSFTIVPIVIGGESLATCADVAVALEPYLNAENLFVISSDFSHYPNYDIATMSDSAMTQAICANSVDEFLLTKRQLEGGRHPNLLTAMCGWTSMLTLLNITQNRSNMEYRVIGYCNSGDSPYGDHHRVVGYSAIALYDVGGEEGNGFHLDHKAKHQLLAIARASIEAAATRKKPQRSCTEGCSPLIMQKAGAFVTLHIKGELRGCIGNFSSNSPLHEVVSEMAAAAAMHDYRFSPLNPDELPEIDIEISVLTPMQRITSIDQLELGRHGIYLRNGANTGTFLPQVATQTGWSKEEFLGHCARDKAGIGWDGWRNPKTELWVYEAIVFGEGDFSTR